MGFSKDMYMQQQEQDFSYEEAARQQQRSIEEQQWEEYRRDMDSDLVRWNDDFFITKETIEENIDRISKHVDEGAIDPLKAYGYITAMEKLLKGLKSNILDHALEEFDKYKEKAVVVYEGLQVSKVEAGVQYDYSNTDHWNTLNEDVKEATRIRKEFEEFLRTLKKPAAISIDDELIDVNPPIKTSKTTLKTVIK